MKTLVEIKKILNQNGWENLDLEDDYKYCFVMEKTYKLESKFKFLDVSEVIRKNFCNDPWKIIEKWRDEHKEEINLYFKELEKCNTYVRIHIDKETRNADCFTEGYLGSENEHIECFCKDPSYVTDFTDHTQCGFIKHVVFLEIDDTTNFVINYVIAFATHASKEEQRAIVDELENILGETNLLALFNKAKDFCF